MNEEVAPEESLFRAVSDNPIMFQNNRVTSALFKDSKGVSVNRSNEDAELSFSLLVQRFCCKNIAELSVAECLKADVYLKYLPKPDNIFHTEMHDSVNSVKLSKSKAKKLAKLCVLKKV
jgi:hypothetical protein